MLDIAEAEQPGQAKPGTVKGRFYNYPFLCIPFYLHSFHICSFLFAFCNFIFSYFALFYLLCSGTGMYGGNLDLVSRRENVQVILEESWSSNTTTQSHEDIAQVITV